jgi:hypothetical protein
MGAALNATVPLLSQGGGMSESTMVSGLREALRIGTSRAVETVSRTGGYLQNPDIRIPLPEEVRQAESLVRSAGFGGLVDDFETSMNRAAEQAAPEAREVFWQALKRMSFAEARSILKGEDDAATRYFEQTTRASLHKRFEPIIHETMAQVGVTGTYQQLRQGLSRLPAVSLQELELDSYVTGKALDGLFTMLAREEKAIRDDPAARTTDLLRRVFGGSS